MKVSNIFATRPKLTFTERRALVRINHAAKQTKSLEPVTLADKVNHLMSCTTYNSTIDYSQTI